jgi:hypothetical protein
MMKSRGMRWTGHVTRMGENRDAYRILVGKPEEKRPLETLQMWADDIKTDYTETG